MTNRYRIVDYTEAEIRALPAGAMLDWLAMLGLGATVKENQFSLYGKPVVHLIALAGGQRIGWWWLVPGGSAHHGPEVCDGWSVSRDHGAAMRALMALKDDVRKHDGQLTIWFTGETETCVIMVEGRINFEHDNHSPFVAIAQACALWGLWKAKAAKEEAQ